MYKSLLILLLISKACMGDVPFDSLYNSDWKVGLRLSSEFSGNIIFGVPVTKNLFQSSFNAESGIYWSGISPQARSPYFPGTSQDQKHGYQLAVPLKIKYDRDGMFLSSGINNRYWYLQDKGKNYVGEPYESNVHAYFLNFNFAIGFEKYLANDCEIFVDIFYERILHILADVKNVPYDSNNISVIGISVGMYIRMN